MAKGSRPADAELERMRLELGDMRRELAQARLEVSAFRQAVGAARAPDDDATNAPELDEAAAEADPALAVQPIDGFAQDAMRFEHEPADRAWDPSPQLHRDLNAVLPKGSSIRSLECRSSLCRLETTHGDAQRYEAFNRHFTFFAGEAQVWRAGATFQVTHEPEHEGDALQAVAYLHRDDGAPER